MRERLRDGKLRCLEMRARGGKQMRTIVDIKPEHRDALLALAARRGQKGFSLVLAEAIEEYLDEERTR